MPAGFSPCIGTWCSLTQSKSSSNLRPGEWAGRLTILRDLKRQQRRWARFRGIAIDQNGYVADPADNLFLPLSATFHRALTEAGGGETKLQRNRPPKLQALHSSAVLVINVFQYWEGRAGPELPRALSLDGSLESVEIERRFPTGLTGMPPTADVVLGLSGNRVIAIESKFTEWMTKQRPDLERLNKKYLQPGALWMDAGLPRCQQLAADIAAGSESFRKLDAPQLLKHALGLAQNAPGRFSLLYLYFDDANDSASAARHRAEIGRFAERIDTGISFRAMTYQALAARLAGEGGVDTEYLEYLRGRYF